MATTPKGYPYPVGTDRVMDGDNVIQALATAVDTQLGTMAAGSIVLTPPGGGAAVTGVVTFPAGRFTAPPIVLTTMQATSNTVRQTGASGATNTSVTVMLCSASGAAVGVAWLAIQI